MEQFALEHKDTIQVVGVGSQDYFGLSQGFLDDTGIAGSEVLTMLWEDSGRLWRLNDVRTNSSIQLYPHDLGQPSGVMLYNDRGLQTVLDAVIQEPWAPADAPFLLGPSETDAPAPTESRDPSDSLEPENPVN